ncbi:MAG TPA: hypothetical protein VGH25_01630, partial [Dongiaceae bacterium]
MTIIMQVYISTGTREAEAGFLPPPPEGPVGPAPFHGVVALEGSLVGDEFARDKSTIAGKPAAVGTAEPIRDGIGSEDSRSQRLDDPLGGDRVEAACRVADRQQRQIRRLRQTTRARWIQTGGGKGSRRAGRGRDEPRFTERLHPGFRTAKPSAPEDIGVGHAGDHPPSPRKGGRIPPAIGEGFDHRALACFAGALEMNVAADEPVAADRPGALHPRQHHRPPRRIQDEAGRQSLGIGPVNDPPESIGMGEPANLRPQPAGAAFLRRLGQHPVETGAVEPPAALMRRQQELVAPERRPAPGRHRAIGG